MKHEKETSIRLPITGVERMNLSGSDARNDLGFISQLEYRRSEGEPISMSTAYYREGQKPWTSTAYAVIVIDPKLNPHLKKKKARDRFISLALEFPNVRMIQEGIDDQLEIYWHIGHLSWLEFRPSWSRYTEYFCEVLGVVIKPCLEPEWQDSFPYNFNDSFFSTLPVQELNEFLPQLQGNNSFKDILPVSDMGQAHQLVMHSKLLEKILEPITILLQYGVSTTSTPEEEMHRALECASLGPVCGRVAYRLLCALHWSEEEHWDDRFTGALALYRGQRDVNTFLWCYENIYALLVHEQIRLEQQHSNQNNEDDEQQ